MSAGAMIENLDEAFSVRTFIIALVAFLVLPLSLVLYTGLTGKTPPGDIEKIVSLNGEKTVAVNSGDLNELDITAPPPKAVPEKHSIEAAIGGLHEKSPYGDVPIIRKSDGLTSFKAYAMPFVHEASAKAIISFVMVDFGLSEKNSANAVSQLPDGVSFALDANARDAQKWTDQARQSNHEVWVSIPLQPVDYPKTDTGPKTILTSLSPDEGNKRLLQTLGLATGYVGIVTGNGAAFKDAKPSLQGILSSASERGLGIIQSDPSDRSVGPLVAQTKAPYAQGNIWIDQVNSEKDLATKFIEIEAIAAKTKKLIVFFRPYPATIKTIAKWSGGAEKRGIQLAPLSATIQK